MGTGDTVAVVGASGALGHVAVQLAAGLGARVVAVASGPDGVELCQRLGAATARLRPGGRAAHPTGTALEEGRSQVYNGEPDAELTARLHRAVRNLRVEVHVGGRFTPSTIDEAHTALGRHHLGKLILDTTELRLSP